MAYEKLNFVDYSAPYLNAKNLNHIEDGIAASHNNVVSTLPDMTGEPASNLPFLYENRPVWWIGTDWVDALGNPIDTVYITKE